MSVNVALQASLTVAPGTGSTPSFPSGQTAFSPTLNPSPKTASVDTGPMRPLVNSPGSYLAMPGVGTAGPVTKATFLYLSVGQGSFLVRLTTIIPAGGTNVAVVPLSGTMMWEFPAGSELTLLELEGAGQVEYYACGNQ